jgi:hypothetical protein
MAFPVIGKSVGSGVDQLKAQIVGIIRDEIRASQRGGIGIAPSIVYQSAANFALSATFSTLITKTVTVPLGMTSAALFMASRVYVVDTNTTGGWDTLGSDFVYTSIAIAANSPASMPVPIKGGGTNSCISSDPFSLLLVSLTPGSTFNITVSAKSSYTAFAASAVNGAELNGSIQWFR